MDFFPTSSQIYIFFVGHVFLLSTVVLLKRHERDEPNSCLTMRSEMMKKKAFSYIICDDERQRVLHCDNRIESGVREPSDQRST